MSIHSVVACMESHHETNDRQPNLGSRGSTTCKLYCCIFSPDDHKHVMEILERQKDVAEEEEEELNDLGKYVQIQI